PGKVDDGADDAGGSGVTGHREDEALVDLDLADGEFLQVRESRVAGAEVVGGEPEAAVRDLVQDGGHAFRVGHDPAFGDLQHQSICRQFVPGEHVADLAGPVRVEKN